ncbi:folate-sensitive fragile site protein Fra10Ac1-domain-containing protein [Trametes gibbosa]|nr:folate-sensitive fragile site protein Fra10Ac1-domain-containing protein [Trametes gibbosa]
MCEDKGDQRKETRILGLVSAHHNLRQTRDMSYSVCDTVTNHHRRVSRTLLSNSWTVATPQNQLSLAPSSQASNGSNQFTRCGTFEARKHRIRHPEKLPQVRTWVHKSLIQKTTRSHRLRTHRFLREDDDLDERQLSWDDRLAKKYYSSLYREYAVCDLKHYKSGNFALRWRTEEEVLSGAGETTCGNTRCPLHKEFPEDGDDIRPSLNTLELPFSYLEHGESKFALVKVVLCPKCVKKLMYKRNKEKEKEAVGKFVERAGDEHHSTSEKDPEHKKRRRSQERQRNGDEEPHQKRHRSKGRD